MNCSLCLKKRKLCDSHIFPEFFYKETYDHDHRFNIISNDPNQYNKRPSKGIYEKLFCKECEDIIGKNEDYAAKFFQGGLSIKVENFAKHTQYCGVDYAKFKLFQMSLIWRAGITKRPEFKETNLGEKHTEILRIKIYNEDPGEPLEYPCYISFDPSIKNMHSESVFPPIPSKILGHHCYTASLGGFRWLFFISSHTTKLPSELIQRIVTKDGSFAMYKDDKFIKEDIANFVSELSKLGKIPKLE